MANKGLFYCGTVLLASSIICTSYNLSRPGFNETGLARNLTRYELKSEINTDKEYLSTNLATLVAPNPKIKEFAKLEESARQALTTNDLTRVKQEISETIIQNEKDPIANVLAYFHGGTALALLLSYGIQKKIDKRRIRIL